MTTTPFEQAAAQVRGTTPTITVAGEEFVLHGRLTQLDVSELARAADLDSSSAEGAAVLADLFRAAFGAEGGPEASAGRAEYARFRKLLRRREDGDELTIDAIGMCIEAFAGFPTQQPSASSASSSTSTPSSKDDGSLQAAQQVVPGQLVAATVEEPSEAQAEASQEAPRPVLVNLGRRAS